MTALADLHIKTCLFDDENSALRHIRETVFQQEQGIDAALEWDGLDAQAVHLLATLGGKAIGTARLREIQEPATLKLERLAILKPYRNQGIGSEMVHTAIAYSQSQNYAKLRIHAQVATQPFYEGLGFVAVGEPFTEAGLMHLRMERSWHQAAANPT